MTPLSILALATLLPVLVASDDTAGVYTLSLNYRSLLPRPHRRIHAQNLLRYSRVSPLASTNQAEGKSEDRHKGKSQRRLDRRAHRSVSIRTPRSTVREDTERGFADDVLGETLRGVDGLVAGVVRGITREDPAWGITVEKAGNEDSDNEWYSNITIGTPPQRVGVMFDTGSADLFVFGPDCPACELPTHAAFHPNASSSFVNTTRSWNMSYASGDSSAGYVGFDTVRFGSSSSSVVSVRNQSVEVAGRVAGSVTNGAESGILGLAQDRLSTVGAPTPFSQLVQDGQLKKPVLSCRLVAADHRTGQGGGGEYVFGEVPARWAKGGERGVRYTNVTSSVYWGVNLDAIVIDGVNVMNASDPHRAIVDTGTTLVLGPDSLAARIHARIPQSFYSTNESIWVVPCNVSSPSVFFSFPDAASSANTTAASSTFAFGLPARSLPFQPARPLPPSSANNRSDYCMSGIQGGSPHFVVLGDVFLKNHLAVFDYGSKAQTALRVGFANRTDVDAIV